MLCRNEFSSRLQKRRLFLCFQRLLRFWYATVWLLVPYIAFIVFFQAGFQVFGTADIEMGSGGFINEYVNVVEVGHQRKSFRITFVVVRCRVARLHLLCRLRRGSLPRWVRSSIHLLRNWLAEAKSRLCRDEDWWAMRDSNPRHFACKANALTNWANRPFKRWDYNLLHVQGKCKLF